MKDPWIKVGYIANTHGVQGHLRVESLSDIPDRLLKLENAYAGENRIPVRIVSPKIHKGMTLLRFEGFNTINEVLPFKGAYLYVREEEKGQLPEGSWYHHDLIGLKAYDEHGAEIGHIANVIEAPAHDVLILAKPDSESLIPFVDAFVRSVDLEKGRIVLHLIEGM